MTSLRRLRIGVIQSEASLETLEASVGRISGGLTHLAANATAGADEDNISLWRLREMTSLEVICSPALITL